MKRLVIPIEMSKGINSRISGHFGRAPFFMVIEIDEEGKVVKQEAVPNDSEHFGGKGLPPDRILKLKPDAVVTHGMGPRALSRFQNAKVAVLRANSNTVKELLSSYAKDELEELTDQGFISKIKSVFKCSG